MITRLNLVLSVGETDCASSLSESQPQNRDIQISVPLFIPLHTAFLTASETGIIFVDRFNDNM